MNQKRICDACKKKIGSKEPFYILVDMNKGKELSRKFMHKSCQEEADKKRNNPAVDGKLNEEMLSTLKMVKQMYKSMGVPEVVEI